MQAKIRVSLTVNKDAVESAKEHGLNMSRIADEAIQKATHAARVAAWQAEYGPALREAEEWVERRGNGFAGIASGPFAPVAFGRKTDAV